MAADFDVLVLGGGPAGVAAARGLAARGLRTGLVAQPRRPAAFEGLAERALDGLRHAGCMHALATPATGVRREAVWNGAAFGGNREWITDRAGFDAALLRDAAEGGVTVIEARAGRAVRTDAGWRIEAAAAELRARFLIEARGRAAPRAAARQGPATTALARRWRLPPGRPAESAIAPFDAGWMWYATDGREAVLQVFVDTAAGLPGRSGLAAHYAALVARVPALAARLDGAAALGEVHGRYAQTVLNGELVSPDHLRIGDAAFAIDPLSGHGVFEALGMGLAAVAVVNTLLHRPAAATLAAAFWHARVGGDFLRKARIGRDFYREEPRWLEQPFWAERHAWPDAEAAHAPAGAGAVRIERRPVSVDGYIVEEDVILTPEQPRGVWQVAGVPLAALWRAAGATETPDALVAAYAARHTLAPDAVRAALVWLDRQQRPAPPP